MEFTYHFNKDHPQRLREYLKSLGFSKGLLAKVKFSGGQILVNGTVENVLYHVQTGDTVTIHVPAELPHETVLFDETPLTIIYEDEHFLVVNKPSNVASIPAQYHRNGTMANRVKAYLVRQNYENQVIHIVTRLDRDTTGVMLFAKHGFAHALMDIELRQKRVHKEYVAFVGGAVNRLAAHACLTGKVIRDPESILRRKIVPDDAPEGKSALTEYWLEKNNGMVAKVRVRLHTGRTHQIRAHFASLGCPLIGDELYGGDLSLITRQALHCQYLSFWHPFLEREMSFTAPLPQDLAEIEEAL